MAVLSQCDHLAESRERQREALVSLIYTLLKVSHEKHCGYYIHPYFKYPLHSKEVIVHQCNKMPQSHSCLLCHVLLPKEPTHTLCVPIIVLFNPLLPLSPRTFPHPSPLVTASSFLESVILLLFCSFSFALLLYSTNEGKYLVLVLHCLAYFTEHNTL